MRLTHKTSTHLPVLMRLMEITSGDVLEVGTGLFSTPYLHWACALQGRRLFSYENDPNFYAFTSQFASDLHQVILVKDYDEAPIERPWNVVLIDHSPPERRKVDAVRVKDLADYIVLHDSGWRDDKYYQFKQIYPLFRYRWDCPLTKHPLTSIISNRVDLTGFHL